ncbi:MAG: TIGR03087 family PEP-CTERM/XrtA system glycosyltransferase [Planctomycetota bacterium]
MRILFLCHRVPFPPNRGDRIATHRRLLHLAERGRVTCLSFEMETADTASVSELRSLGIDMITDQFRTGRRQFAALPWLITNTPMTIRCFASRKLQKAADHFVKQGAGVIVAYSSCMAQFVESARAPRVMEFGDLDSEKWHQYSQETSGISSWVYAREARTLLKYEQRIARTFDSSLVVSKAEAETFLERTGVAPHIVGNGVDLQRFSPSPSIAKIPGLIVFTGIMNYRPNVDGCVRFATKILPLICTKYPNAKFRIVGAEPSKEIRALASDRIEVTGPVRETADHLRAAVVAVAPLRLGRGLQNKVLEAMACAVPIVASPNATAGVDARAGEHFLLANSDEEFAASVLKLLHSPDAAARIGAAARAQMEVRYRWERALQDYDSAIDAAILNYNNKNH